MRNGNGTSAIYVANGRHSVEDFVETIVHELCHLNQFVEKRAKIHGGISVREMEEEAEMMGELARLEYKERVA